MAITVGNARIGPSNGAGGGAAIGGEGKLQAAADITDGQGLTIDNYLDGTTWKLGVRPVEADEPPQAWATKDAITGASASYVQEGAIDLNNLANTPIPSAAALSNRVYWDLTNAQFSLTASLGTECGSVHRTEWRHTELDSDAEYINAPTVAHVPAKVSRRDAFAEGFTIDLPATLATGDEGNSWNFILALTYGQQPDAFGGSSSLTVNTTAKTVTLTLDGIEPIAGSGSYFINRGRIQQAFTESTYDFNFQHYGHANVFQLDHAPLIAGTYPFSGGKDPATWQATIDLNTPHHPDYLDRTIRLRDKNATALALEISPASDTDITVGARIAFYVRGTTGNTDVVASATTTIGDGGTSGFVDGTGAIVDNLSLTTGTSDQALVIEKSGTTWSVVDRGHGITTHALVSVKTLGFEGLYAYTRSPASQSNGATVTPDSNTDWSTGASLLLPFFGRNVSINAAISLTPITQASNKGYDVRLVSRKNGGTWTSQSSAMDQEDAYAETERFALTGLVASDVIELQVQVKKNTATDTPSFTANNIVLSSSIDITGFADVHASRLVSPDTPAANNLPAYHGTDGLRWFDLAGGDHYLARVVYDTPNRHIDVELVIPRTVSIRASSTAADITTPWGSGWVDVLTATVDVPKHRASTLTFSKVRMLFADTTDGSNSMDLRFVVNTTTKQTQTAVDTYPIRGTGSTDGFTFTVTPEFISSGSSSVELKMQIRENTLNSGDDTVVKTSYAEMEVSIHPAISGALSEANLVVGDVTPASVRDGVPAQVGAMAGPTLTYDSSTQLIDVTDAAISAAKLASTAVTTAKIADNAVTLAKLADGTEGDILYYADSGAPTLLSKGTAGQHLAMNSDADAPEWVSPSTLSITDGAVTTAKIADNAVTLAKLEDGTAGDILYYGTSGAPTRLSKGTASQQLAMNSGATAPEWITPATLSVTDGSITTAKLADSAVTTDKIANNDVTASKIALNAVTLARMEHGTEGDILYYGASGAPSRLSKGTGGQQLVMNSGATAPEWSTFSPADTSITTAKIADNAVTLAKLEDGTAGDVLYYGTSGAPTRLSKGTAGQALVMNSGATAPEWSTLDTLADGSVTTAKIANDAVTTAKIADVAITKAKVLGGTVTNITVDNGGSGYAATDQILFTAAPAGHEDLQASLVLDDDGTITSVTITQAGEGYTSTPVFVIITGTGSGAQLTLTMGGAIGTIQIDDSAVVADKIADNAVTLAKLEDGTAGDILYYGTSGAPTRLAKGTANQQLVMNSGATAPEWATPATLSITDGAVTTAKLADDAVTSTKLGNSAVTASKIALNAVTLARMEHGSEGDILYYGTTGTPSRIQGVVESTNVLGQADYWSAGSLTSSSTYAQFEAQAVTANHTGTSVVGSLRPWDMPQYNSYLARVRILCEAKQNFDYVHWSVSALTGFARLSIYKAASDGSWDSSATRQGALDASAGGLQNTVSLPTTGDDAIQEDDYFYMEVYFLSMSATPALQLEVRFRAALSYQHVHPGVEDTWFKLLGESQYHTDTDVLGAIANKTYATPNANALFMFGDDAVPGAPTRVVNGTDLRSWLASDIINSNAGLSVSNDKLSIAAGNIATTMLADNAVTLAKFADGTEGAILYYGDSGAPTLLSKGGAGQQLVMNSGATAPEWSAPFSIADDSVTKAKLEHGLVTGVSVTAGGSGYASGDTVTFSAAPAGGTTATGTLTIASGAITAVTITDAGAGYTATPTLTVTTSAGTGATFAVTLGGAVGTHQIDDGAITTSKIADNAITTVKVGDNAVTLAKMEHGAQGDLLYYAASGAPTRLTKGTAGQFLLMNSAATAPAWATFALGAGSIQTSEIADSAITPVKLANNAVTTPKILNLAVNSSKLDDSAVTTAKIADANVTTAKIADSAITYAKFGSDTIGSKALGGIQFDKAPFGYDDGSTQYPYTYFAFTSAITKADYSFLQIILYQIDSSDWSTVRKMAVAPLIPCNSVHTVLRTVGSQQSGAATQYAFDYVRSWCFRIIDSASPEAYVTKQRNSSGSIIYPASGQFVFGNFTHESSDTGAISGIAFHSKGQDGSVEYTSNHIIKVEFWAVR